MFLIGIDVGGTKSAVVLGEGTNGTMEIKAKRKFPTTGANPMLFLEKISEEIITMIKAYGITPQEISGIGISCGGPLDSQKGVIMSPPNLPGWDKVHIVKFFEEKFNVKTYLQNDANACAVAEWKYGAGKGCKNLIFLTFGTGLGAGLILNGSLYTGTNDMAGEVGHVRLAKTGPVGYGKEGSMEAFCSGGGIRQLAMMAVDTQLKKGLSSSLLERAGCPEQVNAKLVADMAEEGDPTCKEIYSISGERLGEGLSILIDVLNPEVIIIGSIFARSQNLLWPSAKQQIEKEALKLSQSVCRVVPSMLGDYVGDYAALSIAAGNF